MQRKISLITASLLGLFVVSLTILPAAALPAWVGNDDGEFDIAYTVNPAYVWVQESFNQNMHWTASPPGNLVSLQYNPDIDQSYIWQNNRQWFQSGIVSNLNGCAFFTIQVYQIGAPANSPPVWQQFYPNTGCINAGTILNNGATWVIQEDMRGGTSWINDVSFTLYSFPGMSDTIYPPANSWFWIRSNICWCGTGGGTTTFNTGGGTSYMGSNTQLRAIPPPTDISTAEESNMPYAGFQGSYTTLMSQSFGFPPPPPPPCSGCHCGPSVTTAVPSDTGSKGSTIPLC